MKFKKVYDNFEDNEESRNELCRKFSESFQKILRRNFEKILRTRVNFTFVGEFLKINRNIV